jgi:hypothetical protein
MWPSPVRPHAGDDPSMNLGLQAPGGRKVHRDWSQDMGLGASSGANYPAVCLSNRHGELRHCATPDYVVFNTGLLSSGTQASVVA